jgi:hypothetical protein
MSALIPDNFYYDSPKLHKGKISIPGHMVITPPKELSTKASKVIRTYLKKTLPVLRLMGGDIERPLLKASAQPTKYGYYIDESDTVLRLRECFVERRRNFSEFERKQIALDTIEAGDLTLDGLKNVYAVNFWGAQDKKNLFNRILSALREHLIIRYMERNQNDKET